MANPSTERPINGHDRSFDNVSVRINERRWHVDIVITAQDGSEVHFVASADSYYTDRSGIWFDTKEATDAH